MLRLLLVLHTASLSSAGACGKLSHQTLNGRTYLLRLPAHPSCTDEQVLPLAILIHCFGCSARMEIGKFSSAADRLGFALAAPEGEGSSFNAPHCCGVARESNRPDTEFIDGIVQALLSGASPARFSPSALFASGFSNGGFLTSHLATEASKSSWAGLSPIAGHEYDLKRLSRVPTPVTIHHCQADAMVNSSGCCLRNGAPTCCCGIVAKTCVPTTSIFERWLEINGCRGSKEAAAPSNGPHAACRVGVGCAAETSLCLHADGCYHQAWANHFPAADDVLRFFARQVCMKHGRTDGAGQLEAAGGAPHPHLCRCAKGQAGPHCLHPTTQGDKKQESRALSMQREKRRRGRDAASRSSPEWR
jgi:poly(3-hydroxybutyrate) depolymerase